MPINQLVQYSLDHYKKEGRCKACKNDCKCIDTEDCYLCLNYIHQINTFDRLYNCKNITYNYILKHFYRYSSEIEYLFNAHTGFLGCKNFKVSSIGCGPCTELFGLKQLLSKNKLHPEFSYSGFELNEWWRNIHLKISDLFPGEMNFYYEDVFNFYDLHPDLLPNTLILNYVLSDIVKFNREGVEVFITKLLVLFEKMPNSCLIINDINYYERYLARKNTWRAVNYMDYIHDSLVDNENTKYHKFKHYFSAQNGTGLTYGNLHKNKNLTTSVIPKAYLFGPFENCGSFQLLIIKQKLK